MKFNNVMLHNVKVRQSTKTVSYAFCVKNGWWISAVFGYQSWLVRYSKCKTNKFTSAVVGLTIPPTVDYDEFVKFVERENEKIYAKHKRYLLCQTKKS